MKRERRVAEVDSGDEDGPRNRTTGTGRGSRTRNAVETVENGQDSQSTEGDQSPPTSSQSKRRKISLARYMKLQNGDVEEELDSKTSRFEGGKEFGAIESEDEDSDALNGCVSNMMRAVISRSNSNRAISKAILRQELRARIKYDDAYAALNILLRNVWGLQLEPIENEGKTVNYLLVNSMSAEEKEILDQLWIDVDEVHENNQRNSNEEQFFISKHQRDKLPSENSEIIKTGLTSIVLSIIIIEENHVSKDKLIKVLGNFGLSNNPTHKNSNIDANITTILEDLERRDYIKKAFGNRTTNKKKGTTGETNELIFYNLGSRALIEFTPMAFFNFIKEVYGDRFDNIVKDKVLITLQKAFNKSFQEQFGTEDTQAPGESSQVEPEEVDDGFDIDPDQKPTVP